MEKTSALDVEHTCRLCCTIKGRMRSLFEQRQEYPLTLSQMIYAIADLKVDPKDGLPQKICSQCVKSLMKIYTTIQSYRENDSNLRKQLNRAKADEIEDVVEVEAVNVKQEVMEQDYCESESLSESKLMSDTDSTQDPVGADGELMFCIKNEPLDEHDGKSQLDVADGAAEHEPTAKQKAGRLRPKVRRSSRLDYKCYVCKSESLGTSSALLVHMTSNHKHLLPFTCSECVMEKVVLTTLLSLNKHLRGHSNPEKCPYCDKRYLSKSKVAFHVQQHHPAMIEDDSAEQFPAKCDQCDKVYHSKLSMIQHVKASHSTMSCAVCGAVFNGRDKLRSHLRREHGQSSTPFQCNLCQKKVASSQGLENHLKTFHSNSSQDFKCSYCPKAYSTRYSRRTHEMRHTRNPNYKAKMNWVQYYTPLEGQKSLRDKECKCNICGEISRRIVEHLKCVHFSVENSCEFCGKIFNRVDRLKKHLARHHQMNDEEQFSLQNDEQSDADGSKQTTCKQEQIEVGGLEESLMAK